MSAPEGYALVDEPGSGRLNLWYGTTVAGFVEYSRQESIVSVFHVEVDQRFQGKGLGSVLAQGVLDLARSEGSRLLPHCPFLRDYLTRHPEYLDLVPSDQWQRFALSGRPEP